MPMTEGEKLQQVKAVLGLLNDNSEDERIAAFLNIAKREILSWRYSYLGADRIPEDVPPEYEMTQVYAIVAGFSQTGAENETSHSENGISRTFKHADMISYIRAHVIPYAKVM